MPVSAPSVSQLKAMANCEGAWRFAPIPSWFRSEDSAPSEMMTRSATNCLSSSNVSTGRSDVVVKLTTSCPSITSTATASQRASNAACSNAFSTTQPIGSFSIASSCNKALPKRDLRDTWMFSIAFADADTSAQNPHDSRSSFEPRLSAVARVSSEASGALGSVRSMTVMLSRSPKRSPA